MKRLLLCNLILISIAICTILKVPSQYSTIQAASPLMLALTTGPQPGKSNLSAKEASNTPINVNVDLSAPVGEIGELLAGQHNWQLDWLDALESPIARRCCGYMWYDGTWPSEGEYHWNVLDEKVEGYIAQGRKLILPFSHVPRWLWSDPDDPALNEPTVPGQFQFFDHIRIGNVLPPRNYEKWEELIYQSVKHLNVDNKYGVIFEAWNEPNAAWFWRGTMEEQFELYKHTARAVKRADPNTLIGGPTLAGGPTHSKHSPSDQVSGYEWMEAFIKYCAKNEVPVDFISWHYYEFYARKYNRAINFNEQVRLVKELIKKYPAIGNPKLVIDEWSYDWNGANGLYKTPFNAAWSIQSLYEIIISGVDIAVYTSSKGASLDAPNPTFGAFEMFNRLGSVRLKTDIKNRRSNVGVLASREEGKVSILLWDFQEIPEAAEPAAQHVRLRLENLPPGNYKQVRYLANDTRTDTSLLVAQSKLLQSDGKAQLEFELDTNGVTLVELTPTNP